MPVMPRKYTRLGSWIAESPFRFMRSLLMFDLPVETSAERRAYARFVKFIKKQGFIMFQKSIYCKLSINESSIKLLEKTVKSNLPKKGMVSILTLTENQFNSISYLLGEFTTDVVNTDDRILEL